MANLFPGTITREQTVWCWYIRNTESPDAALVDRYRKSSEYCDQHHQEAGPVAQKAREAGWKRIGHFGYTCPTCQRAMNRIPIGAWLNNIDEQMRQSAQEGGR